MGSKLFGIILICLVSLTIQAKTELYEANNSNVINLNRKNFDTQITSNRSKNIVSLVHYYTMEDGKSSGYKQEIEKIAQDYDGMFKITAVNCKEFKDICEKQDIREYPVLKVYPPLPAPAMLYEGKIEAASLVGYMGRFIQGKVTELNNNSIDGFLNERPNLPKVILFTDKKGVPMIFKALSTAFDKKIEAGIVRSEDSAITAKYKVNKFPKIMVITNDKKPPKFYEGETKYKEIFDWLNVFSETFFRVGEEKTKPGETPKVEKPWLSEKFPELNKDSANDLCFRIDGIICVILVNKEKPNDQIINTFTNLQNYLTPKIDRGGIKYKFGWINSAQTNFMKSIDLKPTVGPTLVLLNPGKRKRFYIHEDGLEDEKLKEIFDKLVSGDLRFKNFAGNNLPELEI